MNLKKVKILDRNFHHGKYTTPFQESRYIDWDRASNIDKNELAIYTDLYLRRTLKNYIEIARTENTTDPQGYSLKLLATVVSKLFGEYPWGNDDKKNKVALLLEPRSIVPKSYEFIRDHSNKFDKVLTYDRELLESGENFLFYPIGGCWIEPKDQRIHEKTKTISTIASRKKFSDGHKLRHKIIKIFKQNIDVYGYAYKPISNKLPALKKYMFSLTIENSKLDYYFTEKLIDCFMTGVIPVYWGCPSIEKFFDTRGMILIDSLDDFSRALEILNYDLYESKLEFVKNNFEIAKKYLIAEDWIYENLSIFQV